MWLVSYSVLTIAALMDLLWKVIVFITYSTRQYLPEQWTSRHSYCQILSSHYRVIHILLFSIWNIYRSEASNFTSLQEPTALSSNLNYFSYSSKSLQQMLRATKAYLWTSPLARRLSASLQSILERPGVHFIIHNHYRTVACRVDTICTLRGPDNKSSGHIVSYWQEAVHVWSSMFYWVLTGRAS